MLFFIVKLLFTSLIIVLISEFSKKNNFLSTILAAIPLVSILSFIWIYIEQKDINKISSISIGIFWMVIPSLPLFLIFPYLLKRGLNFYLSLFLSISFTVILYFCFSSILKKFGIKI
ncbi:MAG: DUF3147 family protein [Spirochaetales bacterium]|jgi:hypothetical protein|nr:DUF3147 family protein [Exilispira sp.]NMC67911.1 DUF3147 family protein [Spirochaetales bacterium]